MGAPLCVFKTPVIHSCRAARAQVRAGAGWKPTVQALRWGISAGPKGATFAGRAARSSKVSEGWSKSLGGG